MTPRPLTDRDTLDELLDDPVAMNLAWNLASELEELEIEAIAELTATVLEELTYRVGTRISGCLSDAQHREFEELIDAGDEHGQSQWLDIAVPHYRELVITIRGELVEETVTAIRSSR